MLPEAALVAPAPAMVSNPPSARMTPELLIVLLMRPLPLMVPVLLIAPPLRLEAAPCKAIVPEDAKGVNTLRDEKSATRSSPPELLPLRLVRISGDEELARINPPPLVSPTEMPPPPWICPPGALRIGAAPLMLPEKRLIVPLLMNELPNASD